MNINYFGHALEVPKGYKYVATDSLYLGRIEVYCYKNKPRFANLDTNSIWTSAGSLDTSYIHLIDITSLNVPYCNSLVELPNNK